VFSLISPVHSLKFRGVPSFFFLRGAYWQREGGTGRAIYGARTTEP
jgi:hypothetical protein